MHLQHNIEPILKAIERLVTLHEQKHRDFFVPRINSILIQEDVMTTKTAKELPVIERKTVQTKFQLWCGDVDENSSFTPPEPLPDTMMQIEMMTNDNLVSEYNQGVYMACVELLSCPVAMMADKVMDLLNDIIDNPSEDEDEEDEDVTKHVCGFQPPEKTVNKDGEVPTLIDQSNDISDEELLAEYSKPEVLFED